MGGLLGLERGRKNRPAGFRTHILVSLGATLIMMTNQYVYQHFDSGDPVRMGAQVISGIGFLGAGTIMVTGKNQIKGITTAAGLWAAACSGLAIGIGFYEGAIFGGLAIYITVVAMQKLDSYIHTRSRVIELYLEMDGKASFSQFLSDARERDFDVTDVQITKSKVLDKNTFSAIVILKSRVPRTHAEMTELLSIAQGVQHLEEL